MVDPPFNATREPRDVRADEPIRVMVVDDSAVVRGILKNVLEADPSIAVVESAANGQLAINHLGRQMIDVIVLDIEMPVMDGLTALPKLLEVAPGVKIIMASTLTVRNAEVSLKALAAGAADCVAKPSTGRAISGGAEFRRELLEKVKTLGRQRRRGGRGGTVPAGRPMPRVSAAAERRPLTLRRAAVGKPAVIAIGSSTGGPQALFELLGNLGRQIKIPILITQHMPATFTAILADHITRSTGWPCGEGKHGEPVVGGRLFLAPGGYHMVVAKEAGGPVIHLNQDPPESFCRPAVDPLLRSVSRVFYGRTLVVMLTGMGADGLAGSRAVTEAGGTIIAQDEATSVVWGMPGAVAEAGLCSVVLPLRELAPYMARIVGGGLR